MLARLAHDPAVGGLVERHDTHRHVVEYEIALVGHNSQDGMTFTIPLADNSDEKGIGRPAAGNQGAALFEHIVLAVAG